MTSLNASASVLRTCGLLQPGSFQPFMIVLAAETLMHPLCCAGIVHSCAMCTAL